MKTLDINMEDFGRHLKAMRINAGCSVKELSRVLGVSVQSIYDYEKGAKFPRVEKLALLCIFFGEGDIAKWITI